MLEKNFALVVGHGGWVKYPTQNQDIIISRAASNYSSAKLLSEFQQQHSLEALIASAGTKGGYQKAHVFDIFRKQVVGESSLHRTPGLEIN